MEMNERSPDRQSASKLMWAFAVAAVVILVFIANLLLNPQQPTYPILFGLFLVGALLLSPERNLGRLFATAPRIWWVGIVFYVGLIAVTRSGDFAERAMVLSTAGAQGLFALALAYRIFFRRIAKDDRDKR
jgi:hypothetical protein